MSRLLLCPTATAAGHQVKTAAVTSCHRPGSKQLEQAFTTSLQLVTIEHQLTAAVTSCHGAKLSVGSINHLSCIFFILSWSTFPDKRKKKKMKLKLKSTIKKSVKLSPV